MGLFSFIRNAGEKLFGKDEEEVQKEATSNLPELNRKAAEAIRAHVEAQGLGLQGLVVSFDGTTGLVTLSGNAPSQEAAEKAGLAAGNVTGVSSVDNNLIAPVEEPSQYHDVVKGDTLSGISKKYYGNANLYMKIFEANKPLLSHPDKIYVGQKLRIPK
ncbi:MULTISPECIES: peptidoglycan-binding protein LysM [Vitreoscilla]|uniref:Peptidoglycan-binding protein LysM n=1 Tax=Vitreoscilla stercoraria TaxID=61 RepID=A0ABY4EBP5_VITST|nr:MULTISPECIES: peptidoglycan-binding protein LysM [Vitreoscilla]AUZ04085.1 putative LysM domain/BON superfamily protein [Vitreoscilla sp. C1]UOO93173.1 peptidoglycan-binding protein LysM [Vitreoscilla stercoraria]